MKVKNTKIEKTAKILGLMEEKNLSKDWLVTELKRKKFKIGTASSTNSFEILNGLKSDQISQVLNIIQIEDPSLKDIKTMTRTLEWFFVDIVSSADPSIVAKAQARKIFALNYFIEHSETYKDSDQYSLVILPTGDGMAIGFSDSPEKPLRLAIEIHKAMRKFNKTRRDKDKIHIRIGINSGPAYFMRGISNRQIFWGPGIIIAKRIMDLCNDDQIFATEKIAKDLRTLSVENKSIIHPIAKYNIKHGEQIEIYNIYGKDFGNKNAAKKGKQEENYDFGFAKTPDFEFNSIEILLDVLKPKDMLVHHTWIWNLKNISGKPLEQLFYAIGGDTEKKFEDLNLKITDKKQKKLEIISLDVNKPYAKQFHVRLDKPLKKNQTTVLKIEYDWEEPLRVFEYVFSARAKRFKFMLTVPKEIVLKTRVLEVAQDLGIKKRVETPPKIQYLKNKTIISWENSKEQKINQHDAFEFQW